MAMRMSRLSILRAILLLAGALGWTALVAPPTSAQTDRDALLPPFVSLKGDRVNMRTGPDQRHPVIWQYRRRNMPMQVLRASDDWRYVKDWQGEEGWIHGSVLSSRRYVIVTGARARTLHREPDEASPLVARAEPDVIGGLIACERDWCELEVGDFSGWMRRRDFWGVGETETVR